MCGIVAIHSPSGGLTARELDGPLRTLRHRGPDGAGTWCSPSGRAALGHTRLAVVDLDTGDQPIGADGGDLQLVVSGEFYGYRAIRDELAARGRTLLTRSDSEIALHLYALEERKALARLRGEFALVLWDERRGELLAARDRFGIKPLYYAQHRGRLYLASEVKALVAARVPARWDLDAFADHLQVSVPQGSSLFEGIRQVPPGCLLAAGPGGVRLDRYWDLDYPRLDQPPAYGSLDEYVDAVRHAVTEAVLVRTVADIPVGYHLSGGLDSSSVLAIASQHSASTPTAFTVRFDDAGYDESGVAARTAAFLGATHRQIPFRRTDLAGHLRPTIASGEMVQENSHGIARYLQSAGIGAGGYHVVLAGEGGDELFAGYPQFQADLAVTLDAVARERAAAGYAKLDAVGMPTHLATLLGVLGMVPNWVLDRYLNVTLPIRPLLRDDFADRLAARDAAAGLLSDATGQLDGRAFVHQSQYLFTKSWLCNYILAAERLDMAHAVEVRLPFLDHELFETVRAAPVEWYTRDGRTKYALREAMRPLLPPEVADGGKQGFFAPPAAEDDEAFAVLRELVADPSARHNPFFDHAKVTAAVDRLAGQDPRRRGRAERLLQLVAGTNVLAAEYGMSAA